MDLEFAESLKAQYSKPLTPKERKLLQDMRFLIDFVLDHDLDIDLAIDVLNHDLKEIIRVGSLDKCEGFLPKSYEFSNYR